MQFSKNKRAFTMVELLISLAITAILLAAVAVAFNASAKNYQENEEMFKAMNSARQALVRITTQLRTADGASVTVSSTECTLITADGKDVTYRYNSTDEKLYLVTNDDSTDSDYVLCDNVTAMTFTERPGHAGLVGSVQISMNVGIGDISQTVSSAAVIRKNLQ